MLARIATLAIVIGLFATVAPVADLTPNAGASLCEDVQCQIDRAEDCVRQAEDAIREKDYIGAVACQQPR